MPYSKTLERIAKTDPRVQEYEYDPGNDCGEHWLHLKDGWVTGEPSHTIHEYTVKECLAQLRCVQPEEVKKTVLARLRVPPMKTKKVWIGVYGGHWDVVVIWKDEPRRLAGDVNDHGEPYYDVWSSYNLLGSMELSSWGRWFGLEALRELGLLKADDRPHDTEIDRVAEIEITAPWDDCGIPSSLWWHWDQ